MECNNSSSSSSGGKRACSSSSKFSATLSSQIPPAPDPSPKESMDEVWGDLSLSSLHPHSITGNHVLHATPTHHAIPAGTTFLQDFMARTSSSTSAIPPPPPPPPPILLSLNSLPVDHPTAAFPSFNGLSASPSFPSFLMKKRPLESDDKYSCDRRRKRLMKNRESAARSRARKQAYTNELELEVAHLIEENARLKRQQEKLCPEVAAQPPKKHSLFRTLTAPF